MTTLAPPRRRSYSQLDVYLQCPAMYKHKYVDREPEQPSIWTIGGTAFHAVAERYLSGEILGDELALWGAWLNAWETAKQEEIAKNPLATDDLSTWRAADRGRENADWWLEHGFDMVKRFVKWWGADAAGLQVLDLDGEPALERRFEVHLGGVEVLAIPDLLVVDEYGQIDVVDWKSSRKPPEKALQLGVYAAALRVATGLDATYGLYFMTRQAQAIAVDLSKWPHEKIEQLFYDFDTRERAGDYAPTPGDHCSFCPLRKTCPVSAKK